MNELFSSDVFKLFAIIALGKILERVKLGRFSLGIASVFLVAVAVGSQGVSIASSFQTFGLCIFVYAVGIEAGPQFFASLKAKGISWITVPLVFMVFTLGLYLLVALAFQNWISGVSLIGLFAGAFTCTPALATISERIASPMLSVSFGIVYPLTLAGNVYLIPWLPKLFKDNIEALKRAFEEETRRIYAHRTLAMFRITNPAIFGHSLKDLRAFDIEGVVYTRYKNETETQLARDQVTLQSGALLAAVGTEDGLAKVEMLLGQREQHDVAVPQNLQVKQFIVSNADIAGKTLSNILTKNPLDVRFTRIERSGIELCPDSDKQILLGDRITAIGEEEDMSELLRLLGDDMESVYQARFAPISIGIAAGFLLGLLPIPFLKSPLGVTAGVLLVAMILGRKVRLWGVLWQIPQATTGFLKQFGLAVFFAVVGTNIGPNVSLIFKRHENWILIPVAVFLAFVPTVVMYAIATRAMKKNPLDVLGLLAGTLNNSSALVGINEHWKTAVPNTAFAFAYPLGLILVIFSVHILDMLMRWVAAAPFL